MQRMTLAETAAWLKKCEDAYILIHRSPDGDCIGGGYALAEILRQMGKRAKVICNDEIPKRYRFLMSDTAEKTEFAASTIIAVDVADAKLLGENVQRQYGSRVDLCIDHHVSNVPFAKALLLDGEASAACEILYRLCRILPVTINDRIATCLYTGMATDTGCFQYDCAHAETHRAVAALMDCCPNVPYAQINRAMFAVKSFGRLQLEKLLIDHLEQYLDGKCIMICITQAFLKEFHLEEAELDSIAGFPLQVDGAEVGITLKEKEPNKFRISMRSADKVNVSAICQRLGGGGHVKAAGCQVEGNAEEVRRILLQAVTEEWGKV